MSKHLLLLSGGIGSRFEERIPKQYYESSDGELLITKSIRPFLNKGFTSLTVVCDENYVDLIKREFEGIIDHSMKMFFAGNGAERQESIDNGLTIIQENYEINDDDQLFLQEAVRPFVSEKIVNNLITSNHEWLTVSPAIHPPVLFGTMNGLSVDKLIPKTYIIELQVPKRHNLKYMIDNRSSLPKDLTAILDESEIFTKTGQRIHLIEGSVKNVKITFPSHKKLLNQK